LLLLTVRVSRAVLESMCLVTGSSADRAFVSVKDGAGDVTLCVLQGVCSVDALVFSVVTTEYTDLRFSSLVSGLLHHYVL